MAFAILAILAGLGSAFFYFAAPPKPPARSEPERDAPALAPRPAPDPAGGSGP
jgi:hypothetical protein